MKVARAVVEELVRQRVPRVFELCGGMITHLLDALSERPEIDVVSVHHEQSAAFAADAGARMTGVPGVAMATSGPGAVNLLTGIADCYFDSVPAVFITGQVNTGELRGARGVRQSGFQETDIVAMARPVTKDARLLDDPDTVVAQVREAFELAVSGRPGPVLLDIPMDVQRAEVGPPHGAPRAQVRRGPDPAQVRAALDAVAAAERPLLLVGGGVRAAGVSDLFREFVRTLGVPVVHSLLGLDALGAEDPLRVGLIGTYGNRWANLALGRADLVVVLGSRLDVRQTGSDLAGFAAGKSFVQVDIDPAELEGGIPGTLAIESDIGAFLSAATDAARGAAGRHARPDWVAEVGELRRRFPDTRELSDMPGINPAAFLHSLSEASRGASAFTTDVGQNQMWAAQSLAVAGDQRFLTSGGLGAMGFSLPAAIGAALAAPGRPVVAISGDGGMQINIQEIETVSRLGVPLKIVVLNNECLGMVRQFQDEYFDSRHQSTAWGYGAPDFTAVSEAFGVPARRLVDAGDTPAALEWLWDDPARPALLEVMLSPGSRVRPKVAFGKTLFDMEPPPAARQGE